MYFLYYVTPLWKFCLCCVHTYVIILHLNHTICPFSTPHKVRVYTLEYLRPTNNDCSSRFGVSVLLTEILQNGANHNTFLDNENLTDQNSLTHLLD